MPISTLVGASSALRLGDNHAISDAAWRRGIQEGCSQLVPLLPSEGRVVEDPEGEAGYRFFSSTTFAVYIENEIERVPPDPAMAGVA